MPTSGETILSALAGLLRSIPEVLLLRGEGLPERAPPAGLKILRDGSLSEPAVTLSPLRHHFQHRAELKVIVQSVAGGMVSMTLWSHRSTP